MTGVATIHFLIGTKAQLIKLAPIMLILNQKAIPYRVVDSGQHSETTRLLRQSFSLQEPDVSLRLGRDVSTIIGALTWASKLILTAAFRRGYLRRTIFPGGGICVVHGDTLSTLIGMLLAKSARLQVAHVEAGLRSGHLLDPFPEELIRIFVMKRADILLAPSDQAYQNLQRLHVRGRIERISGNTVVDSIRMASSPPPGVTLPDNDYALATCHRLETITNRSRLKSVIELLNRISKQMPVVFVIHKATKRWLARYDLLTKLHGDVLQMDSLDYLHFSYLLKRAKCVVADGGSVQEECAYLGKPCLIIRNATERADGIGINAMLWGFSNAQAEHFLEAMDSLNCPPPHDTSSPSLEAANIVVEASNRID